MTLLEELDQYLSGRALETHCSGVFKTALCLSAPQIALDVCTVGSGVCQRWFHQHSFESTFGCVLITQN